MRVALESRFLDVEDGPTSLRRVCHPQKDGVQGRARHPSDYRGGVAEVWVGEPSPAAVGQAVSRLTHCSCVSRLMRCPTVVVGCITRAGLVADEWGDVGARAQC